MYASFVGPDGNALIAPVKVNSYEAGEQHYPCIAFDGNGRGVVVWVSDLQGGRSRVMGRRLDSSGQSVGGEFYVSETSSGVPVMAMGSDGHFAVVWPFLDASWSVASQLLLLPPN